MSYILEALKKAQAERQLGNAPTLHAPTLQSVERSAAGGRLKKPLLLVIVAMAAVIAALVAMVLRPAATPAPAPVAQAAADAPAQPAPAAPHVTAPAPPSAAVVAESPAPLPAPVAALPPPVATLTPAVRRHADPQAAPTPAVGEPAAPATNATNATAVVTAAAGTAAAPAKAPAFEEPVQNLRDLPEPIQRSIPQVAVGGYIYSRNPSDRLLLIDKVLRHEGEEVAPGLKLEKLLPKEAVFNFKGYRYRVPY